MADWIQYKSFCFPYNPHLLRISAAKQVQNTFSPIIGDVVQVLGDKARVVKGEGTFFGEERQDQFNGLYTLFQEQGSGVLQLPGFAPFHAFFTALEFVAEAGPKVIGYTFTFLEDTGRLQTAGYEAVSECFP